MAFQKTIQLAGSATTEEVESGELIAHYNLHLRFSASDDGATRLVVLSDSLVNLYLNGREVQSVFFPYDVELAHFDINDPPSSDDAILAVLEKNFPQSNEIESAALPPTGEPTLDYVICVGVGVTTDIIKAVLACREDGAETLREILDCLSDKGMSIGLGVLGRLLRCLTRLIGVELAES